MYRLVFLLIVLLPASAWAQIDRQGFSFIQRFQGNATASATILKSDTTVGYAFDPYMNFYAGLPLYFTRPDAIVAPGGAAQYLNGIGNLYVGLQVPIRNEAANYTSDIVVMLPTGSKDRGLNTGRVTFDWNNTVQRTFGSVTPFGNLGIGNTISDTMFFIRPFTSLGLNGHFEGGASLAVVPQVSVNASAYSVRAINTQRIISRIVDRPFVRGPGPGLGGSGRVFEIMSEIRVLPDVVNDYGFATWIGVNSESNVNFQVGYGRSASYDYDTLFFGLGFRIGTLNR